MGIRNLEAQILAELREVAGKRSIRQKDIMEWSTGNVKVEEGETHYFLPHLGIHVAVKFPDKKST